MRISSQFARKFVWIAILGLLLFMLTACGTGGSTNSTGAGNATPTQRGSKRTSILQAGKITEFPVLTANSSTVNTLLIAITSGSDGSLWFTEAKLSSDQSQADQSLIGRITPGGKVNEFLLPATNTLPTGITKGPDGNLWFTESADINSGSIPTYFGKIGYITPGGRINEFLLPAANSDPLMIASGPDGNLWFTDPGTNHIGRISTHGKLSEFPLPVANSFPRGISSGPDGNLWFTETSPSGSTSVGKIGRITPAGAIKEFSLPGVNSDPAMITSGPDGNLWFTETTSVGPNISGEIGRITPTGAITIFPLPNSKYYSQGGGGSLYGIEFGPAAITSGPDGNLWFTDLGPTGKIGHISPDGKAITEFSLPSANSSDYGITSGPDSNLWFTETSPSGSTSVGKIGQVAFRSE
jgi:streptogramin lyase